MKLRNKKTGETGYLELEKGDDEKYTGLRVYKNDFMYKRYDSLAGVLEEWEDYKPAEPLIKDAGMREVLRLWAKVNLIPSNAVTIEYQLAETLTGTETEFWDNNLHIMFYGNIAPNAVHGKIYTIEELCGEEDG